MTTPFNIDINPYRGCLFLHYTARCIDHGLMHAPKLLETTKSSKVAARLAALVVSVVALPTTTA